MKAISANLKLEFHQSMKQEVPAVQWHSHSFIYDFLNIVISKFLDVKYLVTTLTHFYFYGLSIVKIDSSSFTEAYERDTFVSFFCHCVCRCVVNTKPWTEMFKGWKTHHSFCHEPQMYVESTLDLKEQSEQKYLPVSLLLTRTFWNRLCSTNIRVWFSYFYFYKNLL